MDSDEHQRGGRNSVVPLDSLPDGSLQFDTLETFETAEAIEIAAPIVMDADTNRVTHLDVVIDDIHYYIGWNPSTERWERILVLTETEDSIVVKHAPTIPNEETDGSETAVTIESDPEPEDIAAFIWEYVKSTYPDTTGLRNIGHEAARELDTEE